MEHGREFDAIVIGSGIGGLSAASALARCKNMRVLVLEQHYEIGGLTHAFSRRGFTWEVGLHYVGNMLDGTRDHLLFHYLSGGNISWKPMTPLFERFLYPEFEFAVPNAQREYQQRLVEQFPKERRAIARYFRDLQRASRTAVLNFMSSLVPAVARPFLALAGRQNLARTTTKAYLDRRFADDQLKCLLSSQWGDYGLPPAESAFGIHAVIATHYFNGGFFPEKGSSGIAAAMEQCIEQAGGVILTNSPVRRILIDGSTATGVEVEHRPSGRSVQYRAKHIISNVGMEQTYEQLLPQEIGINRRRALSKLPQGYSAVTLYLGLEQSPECLGVNGENFWINADVNADDIADHSERLLKGQPSHCYLSFPSLKLADGASGGHTAQILAIVKPSAFDAWSDSSWNTRGAEYDRLKQCISEGLVSLVDSHLPGFRKLIAYSELSTPLSLEHFTGRKRGVMYGVPAVPGRLERKWLTPRTELKNLYVSGSDICSPGIIGAMMGGIGAASAVIGPMGFPAIVKDAITALREPDKAQKCSNIQQTIELENSKVWGTLRSIRRFTSTVLELQVEVGRELHPRPGQFARFIMGEGLWRDYSIMRYQALSPAGGQVDGNFSVPISDSAPGMLTFLIDTKNMGIGSQFVLKLKNGDPLAMRVPQGDFHLHSCNRKAMFICTGTGITPLVPMMLRLKEEQRRYSLVFGCRSLEDNLLTFIPDVLDAADEQSALCLSREEADPAGEFFSGRVSRYVEQLDLDPQAYDFYVSGNPDMVDELKGMLFDRGASNVYWENY